jgi:hypothetical protein
MTEDQRRALAPLLFELGPMLEIFSELEAGDASHYTPALHLGLTEWRRIKEAFQPRLGRPDAVPRLRCTGGQAAPIGERLRRTAHAGCRRRLRPRSRRSPPRHRGPVSRVRQGAPRKHG